MCEKRVAAVFFDGGYSSEMVFACSWNVAEYFSKKRIGREENGCTDVTAGCDAVWRR